MLADAAVAAGASLREGVGFVAPLVEGGRVVGIRAKTAAGQPEDIGARLVVGADGKTSTVAKLTDCADRKRPNNRFCYMAYYERVERTPEERAWVWMLEPDVFIAAPNDDGLTLLAAFPHRDRLPAFKADRESAFDALMRSVTGGLRLDNARRVSPFIGYTDYPAIRRAVVPRPGVALVGDAGLTCDPLLAIGCGWALQSGAWLADATLPALRGEEPLERALRRYRQRHRRELSGHARMLETGALAKPPNVVERLMLGAAVRDPGMARHFERFASRSIRVRRFLAPRALARAAWVNARPVAT
jgi:flavin-dependent dehydrogenase